MNESKVFWSNAELELSHSFDKRGGFDVADGTAQLEPQGHGGRYDVNRYIEL